MGGGLTALKDGQASRDAARKRRENSWRGGGGLGDPRDIFLPAGICPLRVGSLQWICGCPRRVGLSDPLGFLPFLCLLRMGWGQTQLTEGQSIKNSSFQGVRGD